MNKIIFAAFSIFFAGAANAMTQSEICSNDLVDDPRLAIIKSKVALKDARLQTFEMLTDTTAASAAEKEAIATWAKAKADCARYRSQELSNAPPDLQELERAVAMQAQNYMAELYTGAITYGQFAQKRAEATASLLTKRGELMARARSAQPQAPTPREVSIPIIAPRPAPYMLPIRPAPITTKCSTAYGTTTCETQ